MGRRRERRQGTGRRTKLDLFMDEIENGNGEAEHLPAAKDLESQAAPPSNHSGVQQNPLSLLGQYSDDDEGDDGNPKPTKAEDNKMDAKVADFIAELETSGLLDVKESGDAQEPAAPAAEGMKTRERSILDETNGGSLASMIGDVVTKVLAESESGKSDWRAVLHEESGDYFYWNVITGVTTWDKPEGSVEVSVGHTPPPVPSDSYAKPEPGVYEEKPDPGVYEDVPESYGAAGSEAPTYTDPATLLQLAETIFGRFKVLSGDSLLVVPLRARLAIEAEIRLSDCRLLASQGVTGGVSWSFIEAHMKRLDSLLAVEEAALLAEMEQKPVAEDEDVDMDVDMEIDTGTGESDAQGTPPPPPDEEWAPPPPPEEPPSSTISSEGRTALECNGDVRRPCNGETSTATSSSSSSAAVKYSDRETISVPAAIIKAAAAAKKTGKVARVNKRNSSSLAAGNVNKKVCSLVNKWIAAKEELHESEDEDEQVLYDPEAQERKRQKELEDWRREQIASGQALDNANFQPLGPVDWRERVRRAKKEDKSKTPKRPNLELLSKGLAPGWKAYWDESSLEVYYGNLSTSETTWDRPN